MLDRKGVIISIISILVIAGIISGIYSFKKAQENRTNAVEIKFIDGKTNETISTEKIQIGNDANVPTDPKHEGCIFEGWYTEDGVQVTDFKNIQEGVVLYSKCKDIYYTVKFYDTISKKVIEKQKVKHGESADLPVAPNHNGYYFRYWSGNYESVKSNVTIYAIYKGDFYSYKVEYYKVDGDVETLYKTVKYNALYNKTVNVKTIDIEGYSYDSSYDKNVSSLVVKNNSGVLKAYYTKNKYNVTINDVEKTYYHGDQILLEDIEKNLVLTYVENENVVNKLGSVELETKLIGYCLDDENCVDIIPVNTTVTVTKNAVYYPIYEEREFTLTNGDGYSDEEGSYSFDLWNNELSEAVVTPTITISKDTSLTAVYSQNLPMLTLAKSSKMVPSNIQEENNEQDMNNNESGTIENETLDELNTLTNELNDNEELDFQSNNEEKININNDVSNDNEENDDTSNPPNANNNDLLLDPNSLNNETSQNNDLSNQSNENQLVIGNEQQNDEENNNQQMNNSPQNESDLDN